MVQLSRMGVGAGFGELVEGRGRGEDGESSEEYDSDVDAGKRALCIAVLYCL